MGVKPWYCMVTIEFLDKRCLHIYHDDDQPPFGVVMLDNYMYLTVLLSSSSLLLNIKHMMQLGNSMFYYEMVQTKRQLLG